MPAIPTAIAPTWNEMPAPYSSRLKMSRPNSSVPKR